MFRELGSLNPLLDPSLASADVGDFIYSQAFRLDADGNPLPDAVDVLPTRRNGGVSADGLVVRFHLRPNLKWQDGRTLTSADLWFTWRAIMNPANPVFDRTGYDAISAIDYRNPRVAVVRFKRRYADYLGLFDRRAPILPAHILAPWNDAKGRFARAPFNALPLSSGPFRVLKWIRGSELDLEPNPLFYRPVRAGRIVIRLYANSQTAISALRAGEIDLLPGLSAEDYVTLRQSGLAVASTRLYAFLHVDFNLRRSPFQNDIVRRALALAVNRADILRNVYHGQGDLSDWPSPPALGGGAAKLFDPVTARLLLDRNGWRPSANGWRENNGARLAFSLVYPAGHDAVPLMLQRDWQAVGAKVELRPQPAALLTAAAPRGTLRAGKFDAAVFAWYLAPGTDLAFMYSARSVAPGGWNIMGWRDPLAEEQLRRAASAGDWANRQASYRRFARRFAQQVPSVVLLHLRQLAAFKTPVRGFMPSPTSAYWNCWSLAL